MPGALAGVAVLRSLPAEALQVAVTLGRRRDARRAAGATAHVPAWAAGLAAGALTTSTSTNGPPMLLHLLGRGATPAQVRDTLTVLLRRARAGSAPRRCSPPATPALPDGTLSPRSCPPCSPATSSDGAASRGYQKAAL